MQRLSPLDSSFLHLETDDAQMHIGSICVFDGPAPAQADLLRHYESRLGLVPRYRQKVRLLELPLARPVWVDDPHFKLDFHLRRTALPHPGGEGELCRFVATLMSQHLDRARPLWETYVVEGLEDERWALVAKVHHAVVDGVAGNEMMGVLLDTEPHPAAGTPIAWRPEPSPSTGDVVRESISGVLRPLELIQGLPLALRQPKAVALRALATGLALLPLGKGYVQPLETSLTGPVGPHRRWARTDAALADVKRIRHALGGTVNDVMLAGVTAGFRELLRRRGEPLAGRRIRALVPVSVRVTSERGDQNNRVSGVFPQLPVGIDDPVARLEDIRAQMDRVKARGEAVAGEVLTTLSGFAPPLLLSLASQLAMQLPQRAVGTVTSNVPGPQRSLYLLGRRMREASAYIPVGFETGINVAIFSYDGSISFGVTGDYEAVPDIDVLCEGIDRGIAELIELAAPRAHRTPVEHALDA